MAPVWPRTLDLRDGVNSTRSVSSELNVHVLKDDHRHLRELAGSVGLTDEAMLFVYLDTTEFKLSLSGISGS